MILLKRLLIVALSLLCLIALAACGSSASSNTATNGNQTTYAPKPKASIPTQPKPPAQQSLPTPTASGNQNTTNGGQNTTNMPTGNNNNNNQGSTTGTPPQNGGNNGNQQMTGPTYLKVTQASVDGQMTQILTTGAGMTLYYRTSDVAPNTICSGACAKTWPSLLAQGQIITSMTITSGQLTVQQTANGNQVEFNGHPLYTYVGDKVPGQTNGQGLGSVWVAVSVKTQAAAHW